MIERDRRIQAVFFSVCILLSMLGCERRSSSTSTAGDGPAAITVFAAASTADILQAAGARFETATGTRVTFSFAASSTLAQQIRAGAPADIFLSADERWMDELETAGEIQRASRTTLLGNQLVLIAPRDAAFEVELIPDYSLPRSQPHIRRFAIGDPSHVPAGRYARQALEALGWWHEIQPLLLPAHDVRAALRLVEMKEAEAGIVYATDAAQSQQVVILARFPAEAHEPIHYPVALLKNARPSSELFPRFLRSEPMRDVFEAAGFRVID